MTTATEQPSALVKLATECNLAAPIAASIIETYTPILERAGAIAREAEGVIVTDPTQVTEIRKSRELRLKLRAERVAADKARKTLKEESLRRGQFIDAAARHVNALIEPVETRLEEQEKIAERMEAERKARLKAEREEALRPYEPATHLYQLAEMTEPQFAELLALKRKAWDDAQAAARKAEEERAAAERVRAEEEARVRAENERLKREADEREAAARAERERLEAERRAAEEANRREREEAERKAQAEREAAEAKLKAEREAREKAEAEARRVREAEARRRQEGEAAARAAAMAPDKDKVRAIAAAVRALPMPEVSSPEAQEKVRLITEKMAMAAAWIEAQAEAL